MVAARERGRPLCPCCRCPPGHGDIYPSLLGSGMLDRLSKAGVKYLFVSNSDNLGATLDVSLLSYFAQSDKAFIMEVCHSAAVTPGQEGVLVRIAMAMPPVGVCLRDLSRVRARYAGMGCPDMVLATANARVYL